MDPSPSHEQHWPESPDSWAPVHPGFADDVTCDLRQVTLPSWASVLSCRMGSGHSPGPATSGQVLKAPGRSRRAQTGKRCRSPSVPGQGCPRETQSAWDHGALGGLPPGGDKATVPQRQEEGTQKGLRGSRRKLPAGGGRTLARRDRAWRGQTQHMPRRGAGSLRNRLQRVWASEQGAGRGRAGRRPEDSPCGPRETSDPGEVRPTWE